MTSPKFFVLTGPPGVGKTTLVKKLISMLADANIPIKGFYTEELRQAGARVGFDIATLSGSRAPLARVTGAPKGPKVGKYTVNISSFEKEALPLLKNDVGVLLVIDEIGKMELLSGQFKKKFEELISNDNNVVLLATIPVDKGAQIPLLDKLRNHSATQLFLVSLANRDCLAEEIYQQIQQYVS